MQKTSRCFIFAVALVCLAAALLLKNMQDAQAAAGETASATYTSGTLRVAIPYRGLHAGTGQLSVDVLDPEDGILGRTARQVDLASGS